MGSFEPAEMTNKIISTATAAVEILDTIHYDQLMKVAELLEMFLTTSHLIKFVNELLGKRCLDERIAEEIGRIVRNKANQGSCSDAWKLFFEHLPKYNREWYWEFMQLLSDSAENRDVRDHINPNFEEELKTRIAAIPAPVIVTNGTSAEEEEEKEDAKVGIKISESSLTMTVLDLGHSFEDWMNGVAPEVSNGPDSRYDEDDPDDDDETSPETLELRNYQIELAEPSVHGKNTIIVAPTGSGKTCVAVEIVRRHLESANASRSPRKVVFLVPMVNLVEQQTNMFKRYLRRRFKIKGIRGGQVGLRQLPKALVVKSHDILIMTPQILLNIMLDPTPGVDPIPLELFSLIIFDECHHCSKGHPYNEIMSAYLDRKLAASDGGAGASSTTTPLDLPQIIGMTASLGVGGANSMDEALRHVHNVCANMDAQVLSTIQVHREELEEYVSVPIDDLERVRSNYKRHPFAIHVTNLIIKIEREFIKPMLNKLSELKSPTGHQRYTTSIDEPLDKFSSDYRSWIWTWIHELPTCQDVEIKQTLITAFEHLDAYHNALFLNGHVPTKQALAYITQRSVEFQSTQRSEIDRRLVQLYQKELLPHFTVGAMEYEENEMIRKLKTIMLDEFAQRPDSRALVFVCTRELTIALAEFMNEDAELRHLGAARLTGVQASKARGGTSAGEQSRILEKFRSGDHRVLIVTSVAEEGLDVTKCNLIIKYNHVTDEISMVQRRGRGRAAGSRSILIVQDSSTETKEMANMLKERMMIDAVKNTRDRGSDYYNSEIRQRQQQAYGDRRMAEKVAQTKRKRLEGNEYDLLCRKCDAFLVNSKYVRRIANTHYAAVDPTIWNRLKAHASDVPKLFENLVQAGRCECPNCGDACGSVIKYVCVYLPTLSADAFVQQSRHDGLEHRHHQRKWKDMTEKLFYVDEIDRDDLRRMYRALKSESTIAKFEERIAHAEMLQEEERIRERQSEERKREAKRTVMAAME